VDRRSLEYFLAVADHGSFRHAAAAIHVAQPSISQAIQSLERELGAELFQRLPHGSRLTAAGEAMLAPARRTLREFDEARTAVVNVAGLRSGRLEIVAQPHLAADPLPYLLGHYHERYPEVAIRIIDPESADVVELLRSGAAEIALDFSNPHADDVDVTRLADAEILLVLPPGTRDVGDVVPASYLDRVSLIAGTTGRHLLQQLLARAGAHPRILVETGHRMATVPLVLAGLGAALLPARIAAQAHALGAVTCSLDPPMLRRAFLVCGRPVQAAAARAFLDLVGDAEVQAAPLLAPRTEPGRA
jgi:LysR family carnitine catabolism transcriptional activator